MKYTVEYLKSLNACQNGIDNYLLHNGDLLKIGPQYYLWAIENIPDFEVNHNHLDLCAVKRPSSALAYTANLITPERLDWCAEQNPRAALQYAADLITPERLDRCAEKAPLVALKYAANLITPERLDLCAEQEPWEALKYAANLITKESLGWCKRKLGLL